MTAEDAVRAASAEFYAALNRMLGGDASSLADIWSHSSLVTTMHPIGGRQVGWEQVKESFDQVAKSSTGGQVELADQLIRVAEDTAYEIGVEHAQFSIAGQALSVNSRVTNIYRREAGNWKIVHHHGDKSPGISDALDRANEKLIASIRVIRKGNSNRGKRVMASDERDMGSQEGPITAESLRQAIAEKEAAKVDEATKKRAEADRELQRFFDEFKEAQVTQEELDAIRRKVLHATERGEYEVEVFRFPSKWCSDHGRAINNYEPDWPNTLQGKARNLYDLFVERGRPQGFKLNAQILTFPGGLPGDVGLILSWK